MIENQQAVGDALEQDGSRGIRECGAEQVELRFVRWRIGLGESHTFNPPR